MLIDKKKLELYLENGKNVLLSGHAGIGKTLIVLDVFKKSGLNWKYFSGSTLDPHIDFIGVPKEIDGKLKLIRPSHFDEENVEAIFMDEFSRSPKAVRNALMELIQFKSINGIKFPKLKVVWAAINPYDDDRTYDVDKLDPAQLDRFHIQINVPYEVDESYFRDKHGELAVACEWWNDLPEKIKLEVSPRRLDYALDVFKIQGDLRDVLPESSHVTKLINILNNGSILKQVQDVVRNGKGKSWIRNENNFSSAISYIKKDRGLLEYFIPKLEKEKLISLLSSDNEIKTYITSNYIDNKKLQNVINPCFGEIARTDRILNSELQQQIKSSISRFSNDTYKKPVGTNPILFDLKKYSYTDSMTSSIKNNTSLSDHRKSQLEKLANSLPEYPNEEEFTTIKTEISSYANMSYYSTIELNKYNFVKCINWIAFQETKRSNISYKEAYMKIFQDHSLYCKIYGAGLLEHLMRDE